MNTRWLGRSRVYLLRIDISDSDNENSHAFRPDKNKDRIKGNFCYKGTWNWEQNVLWFTKLLNKSSVIVGKIEFTLPSGPPGPFLFYPRNVHLSPISWPWLHFFYIKTTQKVKLWTNIKVNRGYFYILLKESYGQEWDILPETHTKIFSLYIQIKQKVMVMLQSKNFSLEQGGGCPRDDYVCRGGGGPKIIFDIFTMWI